MSLKSTAPATNSKNARVDILNDILDALQQALAARGKTTVLRVPKIVQYLLQRFNNRHDQRAKANGSKASGAGAFEG